LTLPHVLGIAMSDMPQDQLHMQGIDPLQGKRFLVRKRDGRIEEFNEARVLLAIESAFKAHHGLAPDASLPGPAQAAVKHCAEKVVDRALARALRGEELEVELIQDMVENQLMLEGHLEVVRRYILYREKRRLARAEREKREKFSASTKETYDSSEAAFDSISPRLKSIYRQALPKQHSGAKFEAVYRRHLDGCMNEGDYWRFLSSELLDYDSDRLARGLRLERDQLFTGGQLELLREHYLMREHGRCLETPQYFWMRIAMGLALKEEEPQERRALEFYEALSSLRFIPSDLILSHAGTREPRLSNGSNDESPSGWIEPWRRDILDSLDTKKLWLPDLFMKRVRQQASWCLFDPEETGDLQDCCGGEFEKRYLAFEQKAERGAMRFSKRLKAVDVWHQIVASVALTGQPWLGFKDTVGLRSPLPHHESAFGPLGAINLAAHISKTGGELDVAMLRGTVTSAIRMLDNAVDLSLFPAGQARLVGLDNRAIGLGLAGFQETLDRLHLQYESAAAADLAEWSMELLSHGAIMASAELARERGPFPLFAESRWSQGILPIDTFGQLAKERGLFADTAADMSQDWEPVRELIRRHGMRNCATTAISPLDTPARIAGLNPSLDPAPADEEIDPKWLIECAARRQKWTDMGQTLTLRTSERDAGKLADIYMQAWEKGIKTIHQLCFAALSVEEVKTAEAAVMA
jgi:ribonucleotide reductase alpha subunit